MSSLVHCHEEMPTSSWDPVPFKIINDWGSVIVRSPPAFALGRSFLTCVTFTITISEAAFPVVSFTVNRNMY